MSENSTPKLASAVLEAAATVNVAVPFTMFLSLIGEITKIYNDIVELYQKAEHNKRICGVMLDRVQIAETAVRNLKNRREDNEEFLSIENYINLKRLVKLFAKIRKFLAEISQLKGL